MYTLFVLLHLIGAAVLILVVLLQSGKAGDLASAFGGAGSQTAFGTRSAADFLTKATWVAAFLFIITSLGLSILSTRGVTSVMDDVPVANQPVSATPSTPGANPTPPPAEQQGEQVPAQPPASGEKPPESQPDSSSQGR